MSPFIKDMPISIPYLSECYYMNLEKMREKAVKRENVTLVNT